MAMRSTIKRVGVIVATSMMITSCGGNDHPAAPVETSATPGLSQSETSILDGTWHIPPVKAVP
jgi:hypothetical protein